MPQYNNNSNFLNANSSTATNFPPISPSGGSNKASASATNQSNPPTPTDQNSATMSPNRKNSKKVIN